MFVSPKLMDAFNKILTDARLWMRKMHCFIVRSKCSRLAFILRSHCMATSSIHTVFKAVVVAKLIYAASSWCGFATADDRQRLEAVIRRGIRSGLCDREHPTLEQLVEDADDNFLHMFYITIATCFTHSPCWHCIIPYQLRPRRHNIVLSTKKYSIVERNFTTRMLY